MYEVAFSLAAAAWGLALAHGSIGVFHFRSLSIAKFFYWVYVARIYIPSIFIFLDVDGPHKYAYLTATTSVLVLLPLGVMAFHLAPGKQRSVAPGEGTVASSAVQEWTTDSSAFRMALLIGLGLCILVVVGFMARAGTEVALFEAIRNPGNPDVVLQARESSLKLLQISRAELYVYGWLSQLFLPFLAALTYVMWRRHGRRFWLNLFVLTTAIAVFYAALTFAKTPVAWIFILIFVAHVLTTGNRLELKGMFIAAVLIMSWPFFVQLLLTPPPGTSLGEIFVRLNQIAQSLYIRLFQVTAEVAYHYFAVPDQLGFLHGRTISLSPLITGEPAFDIANYVGLQMRPGAPESISANGAFIGDAYANFGLPTVFLVTFFLGGIMFRLDRFFGAKTNDPIALVVYAFLIVVSYQLVSTSVTTILLTHGAVPVFFVWWALNVIVRRTSQSSWRRTPLRGEI